MYVYAYRLVLPLPEKLAWHQLMLGLLTAHSAEYVISEHSALHGTACQPHQGSGIPGNVAGSELNYLELS